MAVKYPVDGVGLLKALGLPADTADKLPELGVTFKQTSTMFSVDLPQGDKHHLAIGPTTAKNILSGKAPKATMTYTTKAAGPMIAAMQNFAQKMEQGSGGPAMALFSGQSLGEILAAALAQKAPGNTDLEKVKASVTTATKAKPSPSKPIIVGEECTEDEMLTAQAIKLIDAKRLYQPVTGSSPGTRYITVAVGDDLSVAVRFKGSNVSVRIEGQGMDKHSKSLKVTGFEVKGDYASLHLDATDPVLQRKTVGALLLGLGLSFRTPLPDLGKVVGKGH